MRTKVIANVTVKSLNQAIVPMVERHSELPQSSPLTIAVHLLYTRCIQKMPKPTNAIRSDMSCWVEACGFGKGILVEAR